MDWTQWAVGALVLLNAGWMLYDGSRALLRGDYVTPRSGPRAGQLGPWAAVLQAVGIQPRSTPVKWTFVLLGGVYLLMGGLYLAGVSWAKAGLIAVAALGLWYLPFGTLLSILVILLTILSGK